MLCTEYSVSSERIYRVCIVMSENVMEKDMHFACLQYSGQHLQLTVHWSGLI